MTAPGAVLAIALVVGLSAAPLPAAAQSTKVPRIGVLANGSPSDPRPRELVRQSFRDLGHVEGQTLVLE
jgi:hypothetical protein